MLLRETASGSSSPALDMAVSHALLLRVVKRELRAVARLYRPLATLAFGRLDQGAAHFSAAVEQARHRGFYPLVRLAGGRAAAYHQGSLIFETILAEDEPYRRIDERYREVAQLLSTALAGLGVEVVLGELPGEYCAGRFSLNADGRIKIAGIAQRVVRGASLTSAAIVVSAGEPVREVLTDVNRALGRDFDPATAGALEDVLPGVVPADVERSLTARLAQRVEITPGAIGPATLEPAHRLLPRYANQAAAGDEGGGEGPDPPAEHPRTYSIPRPRKSER